MRRATRQLTASTIAIALSLTLGAPAFAQDAQPAADCSALPEGVDRANCLAAAPEDTSPSGTQEGLIVVTGSRIARPNFDTLQPSVIISSETIENRGFETLGQAINEQPSFGVPGATPVGGQAGSFGSGQSFVNFLGLGDQRTLVLVNGRRFVSSNTASIFGPTSAGVQVDLNAINTRLVDRVETIAIGGAPIYGSDAIAGTVNVVLRRNFEGLELDAQYGISEEGDAPNYRFRGIFGMNFAGGRGNVVVSGEYNEGRGLLYNDRPATAAGTFYRDCRPEDNTGFNQCLFSNRRIPAFSESGVLLVGGGAFGLDFPLSPDQQALFFGAPGFNFGVQDASGNQLAFDTNGNLVPIQFGRRIGSPAELNIDFEGGNGYNLFNTQQLLTDTERYNANILFSFELAENVRLFAEGWYAFSSGVNLREQPTYNSALFGAPGTPDGSIIVSINNPFLTPAQRQVIVNSINNNPFSDQNLGLVAAQNYFYLGRANTDIISGRAESQTQVYRAVGGFDGNFNALGREFRFELVGNYGRAEGEGREPGLIQQNFQNAVNGCPAGSTNAPVPALSSTCAPLNLFGSGRLSSAARDYVTGIGDPSSLNEQWIVTASVSGPVATLPGGDLSVALGYEHRNEKTAFDPGALFFGGDDPNPAVDANNDGDPTNDRIQFGRVVPIFPVNGSFNTDEVFGELTAEIFSPQNDIPGLYRLELHGAARYVDHSAAGGDLTWTVEGRYSPVRDISFRGNFTRAIRAPAITELFNPSSSFAGFATDPCDADSLANGPNPATRRANCLAAGVPTNFASLSEQRSFSQAVAGNVVLENEISDAYSVGIVLTPRWTPALRISADYLDIRLQNAISRFSATEVVSSCYDATDFPNNPFCGRVSRNPVSDQLDFVQTSYFNASELRYKGILVAADYRTDTRFLGSGSQIGFNFSYQYLDRLTSQPTTASAPTRLHGTLGYSQHSAVLNVNYTNGPIALNTSVNYTGDVDQAGNEAANFRQFPRLSDFIVVNAGITFNVSDRMRFRFIVDNLFNETAPFPVTGFGGVVNYFSGILGRYYRVGASVSF
jgi:outer membrane receptor protein involved in Fe transport